MKFIIAIAFIVLFTASHYAAKPTLLGSFCPNLVNCFVNPCQVSRCDAYPAATCSANYCGGCFANWYLNGQRVDCKKQEATSLDESPEKPCMTVNCFVDPCMVTKCNKYPDATCVSNYCGGCNAWFYVNNKRVQCD